ncbi:hypothetical protein, variant 2 [Aphanomyces invadans]|uniref:EGF-like domain-containing protein n=1 Tax=Aphanomyces invadans TaxID=157072 RepID=A0A024TJS9_9STRA|nr:hypothetical protein, variant 2 [Aphanomyces invadans]ETV93612.1 hypothetical protein, variant 2 [Aphanomyces invadans]|eukprot:XP_008877657.1 hypothetical protein, variant 2 [Aphanomyces invadans]
MGWPRICFVLSLFCCGDAATSLCGSCSGHGTCNTATRICNCLRGYQGAQCELRSCPYGIAWADYAVAVDTAHQPAECSNMGLCDTKTGLCSCNDGFEGPACDVMSCPTCVYGRCVTMREAAVAVDDYNFFTQTTYALWDADKVRGCQCNHGFQGYDCSQRTCPSGDDPQTTGQLSEVQHLSCLCDSCTGSFALSFEGFYTVNISPTATAADLAAALNALRPIHGVTVTLSGGGTTVCDADGAVASIAFTKNGGDLPPLRLSSFLTGGISAISIQSGGAAGLYDAVAASVDGTTERLPCSGRGQCDTSSGLCTCVAGFGDSDGGGNAGQIPDCGFGSTATCPMANGFVCNNQGTCSAGTDYKCICSAGFTGVDCTKKSCPTGEAWFDEATAPDIAHATAVCSNKGLCNSVSGLCMCQAGYSGPACEVMDCPGGNPPCSGHGTCRTMAQLAQLATGATGVLQGFTYGNSPSTWDSTKIQGCACSENVFMGPYVAEVNRYQAYDCSQRTCVAGADPLERNRVDEHQSLTCFGDGGTFALSFRQFTTPPLSALSSTAEMVAALGALPSIRSVQVSFDSGTVACSVAGVGETNGRDCSVDRRSSSRHRPVYVCPGPSSAADRLDVEPDTVEWRSTFRCHRSLGGWHEIQRRVLSKGFLSRHRTMRLQRRVYFVRRGRQHRDSSRLRLHHHGTLGGHVKTFGEGIESQNMTCSWSGGMINQTCFGLEAIGNRV